MKWFKTQKTVLLSEKPGAAQMHPAQLQAARDLAYESRMARMNARVTAEQRALAIAIRKQELARSGVSFGVLQQRLWAAETDLVQYLARHHFTV